MGVFGSPFGIGDDEKKARQRQQQPTSLLTSPSSQSGTATQRTPRTDDRQRTPNAQETGRKAVPRPPRTDARRPGPNAEKIGDASTEGAPDASKANATAAGAAIAAQKRIKRRFGQPRPGSLLTGSVVPAQLNARTLIGY